MVSETTWTTDQIARMLDCDRGNTTRKIAALTEAIDAILPAISATLKRKRPRAVDIAGRLVSLLANGGRLAAADPDGLKVFIKNRIKNRIRNRIRGRVDLTIERGRK